MCLNRDNDTFILILQTMAFPILELNVFFVPVEAHNRSLFLVSCEVDVFVFRKELMDRFGDKFISNCEHSYSYSINKDFIDRQYLQAFE